MLSYVSGINAAIAQNIVAYREENGKFTSRKELLKVKRLGQKAYEQCAGFLRVPESSEPLDNTAVHPESYEAARQLIKMLDYNMEDLRKGLPDIDSRVKEKGLQNLADAIGVGINTSRYNQRA